MNHLRRISQYHTDLPSPMAKTCGTPRNAGRVTAHPVLNGNREYLRALRAAEMAAWEASLPLDLAEPFAHAMAWPAAQPEENPQLPNSFGTFA
jgi:hypothetical protein